jgi:hypothetical protein
MLSTSLSAYALKPLLLLQGHESIHSTIEIDIPLQVVADRHRPFKPKQALTSLCFFFPAAGGQAPPASLSLNRSGRLLQIPLIVRLPELTGRQDGPLPALAVPIGDTLPFLPARVRHQLAIAVPSAGHLRFSPIHLQNQGIDGEITPELIVHQITTVKFSHFL